MAHPAFAGRTFVAIGSHSRLQPSFKRLEKLGLTRSHSRDKADYALLWFKEGTAAAEQRQNLQKRGLRLIFANDCLDKQFDKLKLACEEAQAVRAAKAAARAAAAAERAAKKAARKAAREARAAERQKQLQLDAELHAAVTTGDVAALKRLLEEGAQVDARDNNGTPVLVNAAAKGHVEVVRELIQSGASLNAMFKGGTALHAAIVSDSGQSSGQMAVVRELLKEGIDVEVTMPVLGDKGCYHWYTALYLAAERHQLEAVTMLLNAGAKAQSTIFTAAAAGNLGIINPILDMHNDGPLAVAGMAEYDGSTALHKAAGHGHVSVVERLLQAGAPVSAADRNGLTPLHQAAQSGHTAVVECLVRAGAAINAAGTNGYTPLISACQEGHLA